MMHRDDAQDRVTACISYFRCAQHVRSAVECLLSQTHRNLTVVVVNDGDPNPPWPLLADITDPRLVRFSLRSNQGPYFATAVVAGATSAPYFLLQDADDLSSPTRTARLLNKLKDEGSDLAISAEAHLLPTAQGCKIVDVRWKSMTSDHRPPKFVVCSTLGPEFLYRAPHHGLFRTRSLRNIGGYYGGFRLGYDVVLTNLILMTGRISHVADPLYSRLVRPDSLTQSKETGYRSVVRRKIEAMIAEVYGRCYHHYADFLAGKIDSGMLALAIRSSVGANINADTGRLLSAETHRLKHLLRSLGIQPN